MKSLSRRGFLKAIGLTAGVSVAGPMVAPVAANADQLSRIGVLVPQSRMMPEMSNNLVAGLRLALSDTNIRILQEPIGIGTPSARQIADIADKADLLVGLISPSVAENLQDKLEAVGTTLIAVNLGEDLPGRTSPYLHYHGLGLWQSQWALGQWAAVNPGQRVLLLSSVYETGYDAFTAFTQGFHAGGGQIAGRFAGDLDRSTLAELLDTHAPDVIYAAYAGSDATAALKLLRQASVPVLASPFTLHSAENHRAGDVRTALIWSPHLITEENQTFMSAFQRATGHAPDAFAMLGYDTGQKLGAAIRGGQSLRKSLNAPRPIYLADSALRVVETLPAVPVQLARHQLRSFSHKVGWTNVYLCA